MNEFLQSKYFPYVVFALLVVGIFIYVTIREKINLKQAENGEDKERLRQAMLKALPGETGLRVAYGHWGDVQYRGRTRRTTYYCYGLAFDSSRLFLMPLRYEKDLIVPLQRPVLLAAESLGIAKCSILKDKNGNARRVRTTLHDKNGEKFLDLDVDVENTRDDRYHPVNIVQPEECQQFCDLMESMCSKVERENEGLEERINQENAAKRGKTAIILSVIGLALCFVLPFVSIVLGGIGLFYAPKPKQVGRVAPPLILSALSLVLGLVFTGVTVYFSMTL